MFFCSIALIFIVFACVFSRAMLASHAKNARALVKKRHQTTSITLSLFLPNCIISGFRSWSPNWWSVWIFGKFNNFRSPPIRISEEMGSWREWRNGQTGESPMSSAINITNGNEQYWREVFRSENILITKRFFILSRNITEKRALDSCHEQPWIMTIYTSAKLMGSIILGEKYG